MRLQVDIAGFYLPIYIYKGMCWLMKTGICAGLLECLWASLPPHRHTEYTWKHRHPAWHVHSPALALCGSGTQFGIHVISCVKQYPFILLCLQQANRSLLENCLTVVSHARPSSPRHFLSVLTFSTPSLTFTILGLQPWTGDRPTTMVQKDGNEVEAR